MNKSPARKGAVLGFDFGLKRIGVAVANMEIAQANPLTTLISRRGIADWDSISTLVETWQPVQLVVGRTDSDIQTQITAFARTLEKRYDCPVAFSEEAYTSAEAGMILKESRRNGRTKKIKKEEIDKIAAALILESWLSAQGFTKINDYEH